MSEETRERRTFVYLGLRLNGDDYSHVYADLTGRTEPEELFDEYAERERLKFFGKPLGPSWQRPGTVFSVEAVVKPGGGMSVWGKSIADERRWEHEGQVTEWQGQHWATLTAQKRHGEKRRELGRNMHLERLAPLRNAYLGLPHTEQPYFLANLIAYITRGVKPEGGDR